MSNDPGDPHLRRIAVDPDAFEAFYREHLDAIHRFVARRVADPHHASDLVADIFLAAIDGAATYDPRRGPPVAWLFGIARNVVADDLRQRARERRARVRPRRWPATARGRRHRRGPGADRRRRGSPGGLRRARAPASRPARRRRARRPRRAHGRRRRPNPRSAAGHRAGPASPCPQVRRRRPWHDRRPDARRRTRPTGSSRGAADGQGGPAVTTTPTPQRPLDSYETALLSELRGEVRRRALSPAAAVTVPLALGGSPRLRGLPELRRLGDRDHPTGGGCGRPPAGPRRQRRRRAGRLRPQRVCL